MLGGTFDPPHTGHLVAAETCRGVLALDRVLLVVANDPWQKSPRRTVTPAEDRFAMVVAAVHGRPGLEASRLEIERGGPSYTIDTVHEVRGLACAAGQPLPEVFLIVGADLVETLPTWERSEDLRGLVRLVVVSRPQSPEVHIPEGWDAVSVRGPRVDVSSSGVRAVLAAGGSVEGLVPEQTVRCIERWGLYAVCQ